MLVFSVEGAAYRGEGFRERKNVAADEQVAVLGPDRMPIDAFSRDRHFGHQVCAREGNALARGAA